MKISIWNPKIALKVKEENLIMFYTTVNEDFYVT